jgi:hypothetical protein
MIERFSRELEFAAEPEQRCGAEVINGKIVYNGTLSCLGAGAQTKFNTFALARMKRDGYELAHPKLFPAFDGLAVARRVH